MSALTWEEPPANGRDRWASIAAELRAHPGRWAKVAEDEWPSAAGCIKRGKFAAFRPAGSFEAAHRSVVGRKGDVYARYVGGEDA